MVLPDESVVDVISALVLDFFKKKQLFFNFFFYMVFIVLDYAAVVVSSLINLCSWQTPIEMSFE